MIWTKPLWLCFDVNLPGCIFSTGGERRMDDPSTEKKSNATKSSWWNLRHPFEKNMPKSNSIMNPQGFGVNIRKILENHHLD